LPASHPFPISKYALLGSRLSEEGILLPGQIHTAPAVTDAQLLRVHTPDYVSRVVTGHLTPNELRRIGFPWSEALVERARRSAGGTLAAARAALDDGAGLNLAGGTHHAFPDHGEGFCVFNDVAIAIRDMMAEGKIHRATVIDCDAHQANGTAVIFADDPRVFTFSIHAARGYPVRRWQSCIDIDLIDHTSDQGYLRALDSGLVFTASTFATEIVFYLAGADPYLDDRFGRLALSKEGLAERDRHVLAWCAARDMPVVVVMAGGYARHIEDTVDIHLQTIRLLAERFAH